MKCKSTMKIILNQYHILSEISVQQDNIEGIQIKLKKINSNIDSIILKLQIFLTLKCQ